MVRAIFISAWIILIKFLISTNLYATATWIVPPSPIPNYPHTISGTDVFVSISPSGKALVTWVDTTSGSFGSPYYATYDGANWSTPQAIPNYSGTAFNGVLSAVNASGNFIVSWEDPSSSSSEDIVFTTYDGTSWTTPQVVPNSGNNGYGFISASAGGTAGNFMLTWYNQYDGSYPYYAIYNGTSEIVNAQRIPGVFAGNSTTFTAASPLGNFMVTGQSASNPSYAIFNGMTWTTPFTIIPNSGNPQGAVFCSAGPSAHFMANWFQGSIPYYAIYDGTAWTTPQQVPNSTLGLLSFFTSSANSSGNYMTNWSGSGYLPYYAIYDGTNWTTPQAIDGTSSQAYFNIYSAAFPTGNFMVTWLDQTTGKPYYAIYGQPVEANFTVTPSSGYTNTSFAFTSTVSGGTGVYSYAWNFGDGTGTSTAASPHYTYATPGSYTVTLTVSDGSGGTSAAPQNTVSVATPQLPPQNLIGKQKKDSNACATERFNSLSWDEDSGVAKYYLYRNGSLIATLEGNATSYKDHNQPKAQQTYLLVAQNAGGSEASSTITVGAR